MKPPQWRMSGLLLAGLGVWHGALPAGAGAAVCAEVRLEIKQEAALEREAFDARLEITNNFPAYGLENFRVNVIVKDAAGQPADGLFFVKISSRQGITAVDGTGVVQPASTATVSWLIIPSVGAGGTGALGLKYSVRADISYLLNGVAQSLSTFDDFITVKPQPELRLEYLLPFEVFADEPLTEDVIEPVEPFPLGVRVVNVGYGPAADFRINSGQPEIVENKQGLAVDFKLLGTYVGRERTADTLLVPFGTIPAGGVGQASWIMATSLSGRFTQFKATFTHSAELGGELTSLIRDVTTYTLVKDVLVDLPGRDAHFDFLVNTTTPRGDLQGLLDAGGTVVPDLIFESDQPEPIEVYHASAELSGIPAASDPARTLRLTEETVAGLWIYASAPVPDGAPLASVRRSDGKTLAPANAWISRHFNKTSGSYVYRLNILDYGAPSFAEYRAELALDSVDLPPAAVVDLSASTAGGGALALAWTAPGEDGTSGAMMGARYLIQAEHDVGAVFGPEHAQVNITTNTSPGEAQAYVVGGLPGNGDHYLRLWTQDTGGNVSDISNSTQAWTAPNPPAGGMAEALSSSSVRAHWTMGNNLLPIGYQVYFATAPAAPWISSSPVYELLVTSHVFSGLAPNTTCFFFGRAVNTDTLAASLDAALGVAVTLAAAPETPVFTVHYTSFSVAWTGGGNPAGTQYLVEVSTAAEGAPVLASSGWTDGLEFLFENLSVDTTYYVRARARNWAGAETPSVAFGAPRTGLADLLPPVTTPVFTGPVFGTEPLFVSGLTEISFAASDDSVAPGDGQGVVAEVRYSVDAGTFTVYAGTFTLQVDGVHTLSYYAVDADGNAEAVKTSTITVDNIAPAAGLEITGPVFSSASVSYAASASTVALAAYDGGSGVRELYYEVSGSTYSAAASSVTLVLPEGIHTLSYSASDNLGNLSQVRVSSLAVDGMAPTVELLVAGSTVPDGGTAYALETGSISLTAVDPVSNGVASGLRGIYYLVDIAWAECPEGEPPFTGPPGTCENPSYTDPFRLESGTHTVYYMADDNAGNKSPLKSVLVSVSDGLIEQASITPSSGPIGLPFTITGEGFGTYSAGTTVALIGGATAPLTLWIDTKIQGTVPGSLAAGEYPVAVMRGSELLAETSSFTVVAPALAGIAPSSGPIGLPFTLTGGGFGNYVANYTRVLMGGTTCPLTLWTDTQIKGTIPGTIAPGMHEVLVERELNGGLARSTTVTFDLRNMEADWIAPSSGPIGMPFTIAGSGFGNYVANYTTVLMGGATCPLTLWTDTQINGTVPGGLVTGQYPVLVERRTADGGLMHSPEMSFTVLAVDAASMTPVAGPIGIPFTIYGAGFGNYSAGWTRVLIGGTTAPLTLWSDTQIKGTMPGVLAAGTQEVIVERELNGGLIRSSALNFDIIVPSAQLISPSSGPIGLPFVLDGTGFGNYVANYTRVLIGGTTCPLTLWTDTQIKGTVPGTIEPGAHEVVVERQLNGGLAASQPLAFTLTVPDLAAVAPSSGPIGLPFTLTGSGFGNYVANNARVLIGGTTCPLTLWTDGQIKGTVPGTIDAGTHAVIVERAFNGGVSGSQALSFELADPVIEAVVPSSAAVLAPFTLTGYNFGNYVAGKSETLIGGATAQLTLWTDAKIQGKLPALGEGDYPVLVRRSFNGGVSQSQASTMTIVEPSVSSMTPTAGTGGEAFNIYGSFFGPYDAAITRVLIGGLPAQLTLWNDEVIKGKIPDDLEVGTHTVIAARGQYLSDPLELLITGGYNPMFFDPLSPAAAFRAGQIYVYPNPAKGGAVPVFHLEFGLADKLELKVYNVAGTLVHERVLTGFPQVTKNVYAYEYAWEGHIASGVYYFTVEAARGGAKLKARGKFAVVR